MRFRSINELLRLQKRVGSILVHVQSGNRSRYRYVLTGGKDIAVTKDGMKQINGEWVSHWRTAQNAGIKAAEEINQTTKQ